MARSRIVKDLFPQQHVEVVSNKHSWEGGNVPPVRLPDETYGECKKASCHNVGELGNGICQACWDKGAEGKSRENKQSLVLPTIHIDTEEDNLTWDIPEHILEVIISKEGVDKFQGKPQNGDRFKF